MTITKRQPRLSHLILYRNQILFFLYVERLIRGVSVSKLRKRPAPDKWSVVEILAHLADTEIVGGFRIRMILGAPGTPIAGFNQDAWSLAGITINAIRARVWSNSGRSGKRTSRCLSHSRKNSGSTMESIPSVASRRWSTSCGCPPVTTSITLGRSSASSRRKNDIGELLR